MENPLGIDVLQPRFTWQMRTDKQGASQSGYQILVGTDSLSVTLGNGEIWDSGNRTGDVIPVVYQGPSLKSFTRYFWSVKIKDENGRWTSPSIVSSFETGMMNVTDWKGSWITDISDYNVKPAPYFRQDFEAVKQIKSARVYIATGGLYELSINGKKIGDHRLDPMYTRFDRRTLYVTYDVTNNLKNGENTLGILLGNGWYNHQSTAVWYFDKAPWRARPKVCMDLRITYEDGTTQIVSTDDTWTTSLSPVIFNSIYTAEHYDARKEQEGWNEPGFDESGWKKALLTGAPSTNIVAQTLHPIKLVEEIKPIEVTKQGPKTYLFNLGRNIAGVSKIKVVGKRGTVLRLKHVEQLDADGKADLSNIDVHYRPTDDSDPFQTDIFILNGGGEETFMPKFNYKGFQYVEVTSNQPIELTKESLTGYFMHSDVPPIGTISTSNETINKIWKACNASYLSNLFGYPTDCPQREKNGWNGDSHINTETGYYNFDAITIYEKWMADFRDEQQPNGVIPGIVPTSGWGYHWANGPDWTSNIAIIPWTTYLFYGDTELLARCYENIKRYVDHIDEISPSGLTDWGLGDWIPVKSKTSKEFTASFYFYADVVILAKTAKILGKKDDYIKYSKLGEKIKKALNDKYLDAEKGIYGDGVQTQMSFALYFGVVPDELKTIVAANLAKRVVEDGSHIDVGLQGSKTILNALSDNGYADLAFTLASQETFPSWGWWIKNGATTFYENWLIGAAKDLSRNHIGFGEINAWFYKGLGGIFPDEETPGFKHVILKPHFVSDLDQFEATHEGPYGLIESSWKRSEKGINYHVTIPANSSATLTIRGKNVLENGKEISQNAFIENVKSEADLQVLSLQSGRYDFLIQQ